MPETTVTKKKEVLVWVGRDGWPAIGERTLALQDVFSRNASHLKVI
jgi:hypothetical protein